jgi:transcriptional regulator with XRE-family HTH domain
VPAEVTPQRAALGRRLRELRAAAFPSGSALARHLGWHQTRVSKLEQGAQLPTEDDLRQWVQAVGADEGTMAELLDLASAARVEYATFRQRYRQFCGPVPEQSSTAEQDAASTRVAEFQPAMIPGLLQTAAYARDALSLPCGPSSAGVSGEEIEQLVATRLERQQILYDSRHRIQIVMGEAALHARFDSAESLIGQLDRLLVLTGYSGIEIGVVPFSAPMPVYPLTNFVLYDDHVLIESLTGQQRLSAAEEVRAYEAALGELMRAAVTGPELHTLLMRRLADLRNEQPPDEE